MVSYRIILGLCCTLIVQAYTPQNIMVDLTNDFGVCVLQLVASKDENVAFSPYGLVTVALILYEGSAGPTAAEIHNSLRLPWERDVTRIGFRDLHRYLKSYFTNDGFLRGLVLSKPDVILRTNYTKLLDFYGFDIRTGVTTVRPPTTPQFSPPPTTPSAPEAPTTPPPQTDTPRSRTTPDSATTRRMTTTGSPRTTITTRAPPETTITRAPGTTATTRGTTTVTPEPTTAMSTRTTSPTVTEPPATVTMVTVKTPPMPEVMSRTNETATTSVPETKDGDTEIEVKSTTEPPETTMMITTEIVEMKTTATSRSDQMASSSSETESVTQSATGELVQSTTPATTTGATATETTTSTSFESESSQETTTATTSVTTQNPPTPTNNDFSDSQTQEKVTRQERSLHSAHLALEHRDGLSNWVPHYKEPRWNLAGEQWFFTYSDGDSVPVLTYTAYLPFAYVPDIQSLALQIPLDDPRYSMVIILPEERLGLFDVLYSLQWCPLRNILSQLKVTAVYAVIPSFTLVKHINLRPVMTQLGIRSLFDPYRADLSTMSSEPQLFVKTIEQVVTVSLRKYYSNHRWFDATPSEVQHHFIANHPFLYFVIDRETEVTLMAGTIVNPRVPPQ